MESWFCGKLHVQESCAVTLIQGQGHLDTTRWNDYIAIQPLFHDIKNITRRPNFDLVTFTQGQGHHDIVDLSIYYKIKKFRKCYRKPCSTNRIMTSLASFKVNWWLISGQGQHEMYAFKGLSGHYLFTQD